MYRCVSSDNGLSTVHCQIIIITNVGWFETLQQLSRNFNQTPLIFIGEFKFKLFAWWLSFYLSIPNFNGGVIDVYGWISNLTHILAGIWLLIHAGIKLVHARKQVWTGSNVLEFSQLSNNFPIASFIYVCQYNVTCLPAGIAGANILVPCIAVKSLKYAWRSVEHM